MSMKLANRTMILARDIGLTYLHVYDSNVMTFIQVFSEHELMFTLAICHRLSVFRLSVCLERSCALLRRLKFSAMFLCHLVRRPSVDIQVKFYGDRPRETPPLGELNTRAGSRILRFWTYRTLYLGNGAR